MRKLYSKPCSNELLLLLIVLSEIVLSLKELHVDQREKGFNSMGIRQAECLAADGNSVGWSQRGAPKRYSRFV